MRRKQTRKRDSTSRNTISIHKDRYFLAAAPSPFTSVILFIGLSVDKGCQEIQRQDSGALGGKTRREYCLGSGDPMEASTDCTNFLSLFAKYREQFEVHGASAGDFRVIMFSNC